MHLRYTLGPPVNTSQSQTEDTQAHRHLALALALALHPARRSHPVGRSPSLAYSTDRQYSPRSAGPETIRDEARACSRPPASGDCRARCQVRPARVAAQLLPLHEDALIRTGTSGCFSGPGAGARAKHTGAAAHDPPRPSGTPPQIQGPPLNPEAARPSPQRRIEPRC